MTLLLAGAVLSGSGVRAAGSGALDPAKLDVCTAVPGAEVASALGARLDDARPATDPEGGFARCVYRLAPKDGTEAAGYVLWLYRDTEFDDLLAVHEGKYESVAKLGDSAILFRDQDQRWKLRFVVRGRYTAEATAPDAAGAEKLARLAFGKL